MNTEIANPFGAKKTGTALAESQQSREIAEIQAAMVIAKRFPRDPIAAMERILNACTRQSLAQSALYSYSRGGSDVSGPSIRLAEAIAQQWGNLQFGIRELEQKDGESTVEAFAFDLETNTRQVKVFCVPHERHTKSGTKKLVDPRDIYELVANQGARRMRACILGVIPGDVVEAAQNQCEVTLKTHAEVTPETIKKMVDAFGRLGVTPEQIQKRIGKRLEAINAANMIQLIKIRQSLKDEMSKPEDWFEPAAKASDINERIARSASPTPADTGIHETQAETVDHKTGEITDDPFADLRADPEYADWCAAVESKQTIGELAALMNEMDKKTKAAMHAFLETQQDRIKGKAAA